MIHPLKPKAKAKAKRVQTRLINKKPAFLAAFVACASITRAAEAVGIDRGQHYEWLESDPEYAKAFAAAIPRAGDTLKDDAVEWARVGIFEPLVYQGRFQFAQREIEICTLANGQEVTQQQVAALEAIGKTKVDVLFRRSKWEDYGPPLGIFRRSEGLMARLLKAFKPDEFGDKLQAEVTGKGGGPMEIVSRLAAARARVKKAE